MLNTAQKVKENIRILKKLLPILSFIAPFLILYRLHPDSFQTTYQGRTFYLFFLWLVSLEMALNWEKIREDRIDTLRPVRTIGAVISLLLPTFYVVVANYCGLNTLIVEAAEQTNVPLAHLMPLSIEYLVFALLFASIILAIHGKKGLIDFSIPTLFLVSIGAIFTIDDLYPYGRFAPFQILVPATATLAANVLNLLGYQTRVSLTTHPEYGLMPYLSARNPNDPSKLASFGIAWPCAR